VNDPKRKQVKTYTNIEDVESVFGPRSLWPNLWSPKIGPGSTIFSSFESQEELKQEIERLHTIARDNAAKHRVAAEADAADTLSIALDGGERVFVRDPKTACVEPGDYFAHWWDDTGDKRAPVDEKVPGWVDGKILRKRGNTFKGRWYVEYAVDEKTVAKGAVWHDFEPAAYGTDRSLGQRWVFLRPDAAELLSAFGADAGGGAEPALLVEQDSATVERTAEEAAAEERLLQEATGRGGRAD